MPISCVSRGFVQFSLASGVALVVANWLNYELTSLAGGGSWIVLSMTLIVARVGLVLVFIVGALGWGRVSFVVGSKFFRSPSRLRSQFVLVRIIGSAASAAAALLVMIILIKLTSDVMARLDVFAWCTTFIGFVVATLAMWNWSLQSATLKKLTTRIGRVDRKL